MKKMLGLALLFVIFVQSGSFVFAQSDQEKLLDNQRQQEELKQRITSAQNNIRTFSQQIDLMDNKIKLTTLQIADTQKKISLLETDIDILSKKITRVEDSLSLLQQTLLQRIRVTYALGKPSTAELILGSSDFSDALISNQYLDNLQRNDLKLLSQMRSTKQNYGEQKTSLQNKQDELKDAKAELDKQNDLLASQKKDKEVLLNATKNDEKRYSVLLAQLQAEQRAIEQAIANSANLTNGVHVNKGDVIAIMGNSGAPSCSTGAHLHFEVRDNGSLKDPAGFLRSVPIGYEDDHTGRISPSGSWDWPMSDIVVTQEFGMSYWARTGFYGGGIHTGIDMISHASTAIRAVSSGTLYRAVTRCGASTLKYAVLDHGNGMRTYYLHIQ